MDKRIISLVLFFSLLIFISCQPKQETASESDSHLSKNHEYLRKIAFCRCLDLVDSTLAKVDHSSAIYFEKSAYDPEALTIIKTLVKGAKPQFRSYADHSLGVGECLELYESDTLAHQVEKLDSLLGEED